jgi:hypothetical protein
MSWRLERWASSRIPLDSRLSLQNKKIFSMDSFYSLQFSLDIPANPRPFTHTVGAIFLLSFDFFLSQIFLCYSAFGFSFLWS